MKKPDEDIDESSHIILILDVLLKPHFDSSILMQCLDSILAFGNAFLLKSGVNKLTILGSSTVKNTVLFVDKENELKKEEFVVKDQQNERFAAVNQVFRQNLLLWIDDCIKEANQMDEDTASNSSLLPGALAQTLCMINSCAGNYKHSRVVVFSFGADQNSDYSSQYIKLINCFFGAQKINVIIDACSISVNRDNEDTAPVSATMEDRFAASVLQQGCDLTGGRYIRIHKVSTLLEHLFWMMLPSSKERPSYVLPPKLKISPPAACFCHRKILEVGYVCSVCVSIFCQYQPYCSTCNSNVFQMNLKQIANLKNQVNGDEKAL